MEVKILKEAGYEEALYGLSLSFKQEGISVDNWWTKSRFESIAERVKTQHNMDGGHNKFLESVQMWVEIKAPRGWWAEADTYRAGVTKQSASTMHTIQKRPLVMEDFEEGTDQRQIDVLNEILAEETNNFTKVGRLLGSSLQRVKWNIPEGFLQTRVVCLNYKALRNMIIQRRSHKLSQWQQFIAEVRNQCEHPELLPEA